MLEVGTGFNGELTGRENIYLNGVILGLSRKEVDERIDRIIAFSELEDFIDTPLKRYMTLCQNPSTHLRRPDSGLCKIAGILGSSELLCMLSHFSHI